MQKKIRKKCSKKLLQKCNEIYFHFWSKIYFENEVQHGWFTI